MSKELTTQKKAQLVTITSKELCEIYNPSKCMRLYSKCSTIPKALNSQAPTLSSLIRSIGGVKVEAYIKLWLIDLNLSLGLKQPLKEHQIDQIAFGVIENYRSLNIADISLIFKNAKHGKYGDFYDRITIPTVLKWFRLYFNDRCNVAASQSYQNHIQHKSAFANTPRSCENNLREGMKEMLSMSKKQKEIQEAKIRIAKAKKK
ncbi:hypothetical protein [Tenacibaculum maritimum]|uniref:hypothetical protein n=1 Tax=Tenacibaculum maritimum TaxID=107401 RepID=UPI003876B7C8